MYGIDKDKVVGQTIVSYLLSDNKTSLTLGTKRKPLVFETYGDCCSQSWIEHITVPELPCTILDVEEKHMGEIDHPKDGRTYDCLKSYSTIFKTDKGDFEIEYRNDSNGYYGGSLDLIS